MKIQLRHTFKDIVSIENLLEAWREFVRGKRGKKDVQEFSLHLMDNILSLHEDLVYHTYNHGRYQAFRISDPKPRHIHKAAVRDRLLHHAIYRILYPFFPDQDISWLLENVIDSFSKNTPGVGLPLGNLTSQLFVNIYMNEFDQFVKHKLKAKYYLRYADDFLILSESRGRLEKQIEPVGNFLMERLKLALHPQKVSIQTSLSGVDFLGWVHFFNHRVLRTATKKRMFKRIRENPTPETLNSYLGLLRHGNTHKIQQEIAKEYFLRQDG